MCNTPFMRWSPQAIAHSARRVLHRVSGFTLIELLIAVAIAGIVMAVTVPTYQNMFIRQKTATAKRDIYEIQVAMERYYTRIGRLPLSLDEITTKPDPWGNPYQYLNMDGASVGKKRKDKSLHPLNTDYDLYSMGPDGKSSTPLTAKASRDDIIRANNGGFVGVAADY